MGWIQLHSPTVCSTFLPFLCSTPLQYANNRDEQQRDNSSCYTFGGSNRGVMGEMCVVWNDIVTRLIGGAKMAANSMQRITWAHHRDNQMGRLIKASRPTCQLASKLKLQWIKKEQIKTTRIFLTIVEAEISWTDCIMKFVTWLGKIATYPG